jgi:hypothetical protein
MKHLLLAVTLLAVSSLGSASIAIQSGPGNEGLGSYTGSFDYSFSSATQATLVISLTNTSPVANGGFITAFAFNNPGNLITGVTLTTSTNLNNILGGSDFNNDINAMPHGYFDVGASNGGGYQGSGSPNNGIAVGATGSWTFNFTGTNLNTLTTQSFLDTVSSGGEFFVVRFRGFNDGGSDKVPGVPGEVIPEPSTYAALFGALAGVVALHRRRKAAK